LQLGDFSPVRQVSSDNFGSAIIRSFRIAANFQIYLQKKINRFLAMQNDVKQALEILRKGGVIVYPTDTIWGIGCDATNPEAVKRVYEIKKREDNKAMLVLMPSFSMLENYVTDVPETAYDLVELSEKPITIIYENAHDLAPNILGENNSIGIRIPNNQFLERLLSQFRKPLVSTSANISGQPSPAHFGEVSEEILSAVDFTVTFGQDDKTAKEPSSIIYLRSNGEVKIIRS